MKNKNEITMCPPPPQASVGTDIPVIVMVDGTLLWKLIIYPNKFVESDCIRAVQFLVNIMQKERKKMQISQRMKICDWLIYK